jgi:hypothetical protein
MWELETSGREAKLTFLDRESAFDYEVDFSLSDRGGPYTFRSLTRVAKDEPSSPIL